MVATSSKAHIEDVDRLEADLGLTEPELASALGVAAGTIERSRRGVAVPNHDVRQQLDQLSELRHHLYETFHPDDVVAWLHEQHHYLGGITPAESVQAGRSDRVEALLTVIDHGIFT